VCIIVDANRAHILFSQPESEAAAPIWDWLKRDGILVYGGKLAAELGKVTASRRLLVELVRGGRAILEAAEEVDREESLLRVTGHCKSDDQHVVALARISGARVLFTEDRLLMDDFQNPLLLRPKGKIYRRSSHRRLLAHRRGCRKQR
jgi:hypothetical protein